MKQTSCLPLFGIALVYKPSHLLSFFPSRDSFLRIFLDLKNLKLTHVDKKRQKKMFSGYFSIHKRKELSKDGNKHYIFAKILFLNNSASPCASPIGGGVCHWTKKIGGEHATGQKMYATWWERRLDEEDEGKLWQREGRDDRYCKNELDFGLWRLEKHT